jgi:hypothetical protein
LGPRQRGRELEDADPRAVAYAIPGPTTDPVDDVLHQGGGEEGRRVATGRLRAGSTEPPPFSARLGSSVRAEATAALGETSLGLRGG